MIVRTNRLERLIKFLCIYVVLLWWMLLSAIFGLLGSLLYFGYHYRVYFGSVLLKQIVPVIILNLSIGLMIPGIDNFAHIGGLIGGLLVSKAVGINSKDKKSDKINGIILTCLYVGFLIFLGFFME